MTISYNAEVASIHSFGVFWKLLLRWKGSIYKLVLPDLGLYVFIYFSLNLSYRYLMDDHYRALFEEVAKYCANMSESIPMSFVLGFYVTIVVQRWWNQYMCLPWPDALALYVSTNIQGTDDRGRLIRRTIMRYVNLAFVYTMSQICTRVKARFPTLDHLVEAGIMTETEKKIFEAMNKKTPHLKYWMPLVWAGSIVVKARKEGRIRDDFAVKTLVDSINAFRFGLGGVLNYDWISVPLVYTQTVTLAVYTFFMAELLGRQFVHRDSSSIDLVVPLFSFLAFFFYMGWLRVAETLFNPFGDDDDDFEINWLIDRNLQVSYIIVDEMHEDHPELVRDQYWEEVIPTALPYTVASEQYRRDPPEGSAAQIAAKKTKSTLVGSANPTNVTQLLEVQPSENDIHDEETAKHGITQNRMLYTAASPITDVLLSPSSEPAVIFPRHTVSETFSRIKSHLSGQLLPSRSQRTSSMKHSIAGLVKKMSTRVGTQPSWILPTHSTTGNVKQDSDTHLNDSDRSERVISVRHIGDLMGKKSGISADSGLNGVTNTVLVQAPSPSNSSDASMHSSTPGQLRTVSSEEKEPPKFLPEEYNFMTTATEEEREAESPVHEPDPANLHKLDSCNLCNLDSCNSCKVLRSPVDLTKVISESLHSLGQRAEEEPCQSNLLSKLFSTVYDAISGDPTRSDQDHAMRQRLEVVEHIPHEVTSCSQASRQVQISSRSSSRSASDIHQYTDEAPLFDRASAPACMLSGWIEDGTEANDSERLSVNSDQTFCRPPSVKTDGTLRVSFDPATEPVRPKSQQLSQTVRSPSRPKCGQNSERKLSSNSFKIEHEPSSSGTNDECLSADVEESSVRAVVSQNEELWPIYFDHQRLTPVPESNARPSDDTNDNEPPSTSRSVVVRERPTLSMLADPADEHSPPSPPPVFVPSMPSRELPGMLSESTVELSVEPLESSAEGGARSATPELSPERSSSPILNDMRPYY